jgi:hypothetical protein
VLGRFRESEEEVRDLVERAARAVEDLVGAVPGAAPAAS